MHNACKRGGVNFQNVNPVYAAAFVPPPQNTREYFRHEYRINVCFLDRVENIAQKWQGREIKNRMADCTTFLPGG